MVGLARRHGWLLAALVAAALLRVVVVVAFPPGFVFSDGPAYLGLVDDLTTLDERVVGYGVLLDGLSWITRDVWLIVVVQHLLGLLTGVLVYILLRRWTVSGVVATLATLPVLFDGMELTLEHSVLSDVLFDLLVVTGIALLAWHRRPSVRYAAAGGLVLGLAVCVRVVGQPLVVSGVLFCLVAAVGWRQRVVTSLALAVAFVAPLAAYAGWYHHDHGVYALTESGGRALYMRTTAFVDCSKLSLPDYEQPLCPEQPVGHRLDPTYYGWHDPDSDHGLTPPDGITPDTAMHEFAVRAIEAQPADYLRTVARDVAYGFDPVREDRYGYDTADKWSFERYLTLKQTEYTRPAYEAHGGELPSVRQPWADLMSGYGSKVYVYGPLVLVLMALTLTGLVWRRPRDAAHTRALMVLTATAGIGLALTPSVTAEFVWRYQLPMLVLLPAAGALAWTRLIRRETSPASTQPGTTAAPSTDWPNGGVNLRSRNRVAGTTNRS